MKRKFLGLSILLSTLGSCFQKGKQKLPEKRKEEVHGMAMLYPPFYAASFEEAKFLAQKEEKRLMVLLVEAGTDVKNLLPEIGLRKKSLRQWSKDFVCVVLETDREDAQLIMEEEYIKALPACIKYSRKDQKFEGVLYGRLWPGNKPYLSDPQGRKLLELFEAGDVDKRLLVQALGHLSYVAMDVEERENWNFRLKNAYLNSFSFEELKTYEVYQILKTHLDDVRLDLLEIFLEKRVELNAAYQILVEERSLKNKIKADWMIRNAVLKSYKRAVRFEDQKLFDLSEQKREAYRTGYIDEWMAKDIFLFQLKQGRDEAILKAATQYFETNKNWYVSREYALMEQGAFYANKLSTDPITLTNAEKWIDAAIKKGRATPSRYGIQLNLLNKLDQDEKAELIREKLLAYQGDFQEFLKLYTRAQFPIKLKEGNIDRKAYKKLRGISKTFEDFRYYIRAESSLFKQSEKIEPIALLSETEEGVEILSHVHLLTGSLLPVKHFRSYYIRSRFTKEGAFLGKEYISGKELKH
ncbi:MAG: hypothetical protein AAF696_16510 [Bacteroidota bacterium]